MTKISGLGVPRILAAVVTYLIIALAAVILIVVVLPTTVTQISQLASLTPNYLPSNSFLAPKIEAFITSTAANSISLASQIASAITSIMLIFILSFYFLISKREISRFMLDIIPDDYEEDYLFLEKTLSRTFASFIQIQVVLGLIMGAITLVILLIMQVNFALSTSILSAILAMVPVVGPVIFLIPVVLAAMTSSLQTLIISVTAIVILAQLIYNVLGPKLLGSVLKIHPIIVLLSFLIGYRIAGVWGAVFSVPVTSALAIVSQELLKHWKEEADK